MNREAMQQALAALNEALEAAEVDMIGVNLECCGNVQSSGCFDEPPECCSCPTDVADRVKMARDALLKELEK